LLKRGKERGFLTYEELNDSLPEDTVSADKIDEILMHLDEMGIDLVDEMDSEPAAAAPTWRAAATRTLRPPRPARALTTRAHVPDPDGPKSPCSPATRKSRLAKKFELTRKRFRTKLLESTSALSHCLTILDGVSEGEQPFDRTLHFDSTEEHDREEIGKRLIENVKTLNKMLERRQAGLPRA